MNALWLIWREILEVDKSITIRKRLNDNIFKVYGQNWPDDFPGAFGRLYCSVLEHAQQDATVCKRKLDLMIEEALELEDVCMLFTFFLH